MMNQLPDCATLWLNKLAPDTPLMSDLCPSVQVADGQIAGEGVRFITVVPGVNNHYLRATSGEVGLLEGWTLTGVVNETIAANTDQPVERPVVAVVNVPSQVYGRREEAFGIHQALAGAAGAYAKAHLAGHPVIGLIVGKAISGAFLARGYQTNRLITFNDSGVLIHVMGKESATHITLHTMEALEKLAAITLPMAYDVGNCTTFGLLSTLLDINNPNAPDKGDLSLVNRTLRDAIADARRGISLKCRPGTGNRRSLQLVRDRVRASW